MEQKKQAGNWQRFYKWVSVRTAPSSEAVGAPVHISFSKMNRKALNKEVGGKTHFATC